MPAQYSSYDRGFDQGHTEIRSTDAPSIERKVVSKGPPAKRWKALIAVAVVAIMVASGFAIIAPTLGLNLDNTAEAPTDNTADIEIGGTHYVNTTFSNMFESYQKVTTPTGGYQTGGLGINDWWYERCATYGDVVVRDHYPFVIGYGPYSAEVPGAGVSINLMKYGLYSFYREEVDSPSTTTIGTGPNTPLGFIPILGTPWTTYSAMSGGWVNWSYYLTYCTVSDIALAKAGTGYMNTYYGVTPTQFNFGGSMANDGWYVDFQGKADFNRAAAKKFLGLTGSADLRTQFLDNNTGVNLGKMNTTWSNFWTRDGSNTGNNDTFATYDYSLDYSPLAMYLSVDPTSTANKLVLRIYGIVWGVEILMLRYIDRAGILTKAMASPEDFYLNGTASPGGADVHFRWVGCYNIMAWKDTGFFSPAWIFDFMHTDYAPNSATHSGAPPKWTSRYNQYYATKISKPTYMTFTPGTLTYGLGCAFWYPPMNWNLTNNQRIVLKLPSDSTSMLGYVPYRGTGPSDKLVAGKLVELQSHTVWGEIGLGSTVPASLRSNTYYDPTTKTLTLQGPMNFPPNRMASPFTRLNATGSPSFIFDLMRVSTYDVTLPTMDHLGTYTATITAKNITGVTVTDWNGTVTLSTPSAGINFGGSSSVVIHFTPAMNGVATTPVTVTTLGSKVIQSVDFNNSLDINDQKTFTVTPEFPTLMIPVIGIMAAVVIVLGRKDKKKDEQ